MLYFRQLEKLHTDFDFEQIKGGLFAHVNKALANK